MDGNELVNLLRAQELDSLAAEIRAGRRDHILKTLDERGRAQELVRQQYSGRYPFELLQNANDAAGDRTSAQRCVRFVLSETALIIADQGTGFEESQIRAICGLGRSSKDPRKSVGYKGLGFKSVGEITDSPQIVSQNASFGFDERRVRRIVSGLAGGLPENQRLPVYAFPFPLELAEFGVDQENVARLRMDGFSTVLRLPFKEDVERSTVEKHLLTALTPRLLLFLDATEQLEIVGTPGDFSAIVARQCDDQYMRVLLEADGYDEDWLIFQRRLSIPKRQMVAALGDAWKEVEEVRSAIAIPLDETGKPLGDRSEPFHVYFPTQEASGFPFIVQADFALELDRRHIATNPEAIEYNHWLVQESARLLREMVVPELLRLFPGSAQVVHALAPMSEPSKFGSAFRQLVLEALRGCRIVPCIDGDSRMPAEVRLLPATIPDSNAAHAFIDGGLLPHLVVEQIEQHKPSRRLLESELDSLEIRPTELLQYLRRPEPTEDIAFYDLLYRWSESMGQQRLAKALNAMPCVRTTDARWLAPKDRVFFPRQRGDVQLSEDLPIPIAAVPEAVESLLEDAGVRRFEWRSLIPEFVLPYLTDEQATKEDRTKALGALRSYHKTERSGDPKLKAAIGNSLLPVRDQDGRVRGFRPASQTYFSSEWLSTDLLQRVYGPFGEAEFLDIPVPDDDEHRTSECEFYEWMGVSRWPRVLGQNADESQQWMLHNQVQHPHRQCYPDHWDRWMNTLDAKLHQECGQGHSWSQRIKRSFVLDRFVEVVATGDWERLTALWGLMVRGWAQVYEGASCAEFYCQASAHAGPRSRFPASLMTFLLKDLEWVPSVQGSKRGFAKPASVWRIAQGWPFRVRQRVPVLSADLDTAAATPMVTALGLVDAARPTADDLVAVLNALCEESQELPAEADGWTGISQVAGWAMRTLNDVLSGGKVLSTSEVPLLAKMDGRGLFHKKPYVAADRVLAETWQDKVPILDADRDLRVLHSALGLKRLDDLVIVRPIPLRPVSEVQDEVEALVREAKPYLAAVAIEAVPSRRDEVLRGLARMEICVCEDLILEYALEDEVRHRNDAVSYIAVRQEQQGIIRRNIGTAHLEISPKSGLPHWYPFGQQLAQYLGVPTQADAFALLLKADQGERHEYLSSRQIGLELVSEARIDLDQPPDDELVTGILSSFGGALGVEVETGSEAGQPPNGSPPAEEHPTENPERKPENDGEHVRTELILPSIDYSSLSIRTASPGSELGESRRYRGSKHGNSDSGPVDFEAQNRLQRKIGSRGEEAVYHAERARIQSAGGDPDNVHWIAKDRPLSPYDITSVEPNGHRIYIEVKSTSSDDPNEAFEISEAELMCALTKRSSYYIYRVTSAHTEYPQITRYQDPMGRVQQNQARLTLRSARLLFSGEQMD